jgi:methylisocitrate lyase
MAVKQVVDRDEAVEKVRAAVDAGTGLVIIARTDAMSVLGLDEAIARIAMFAEAGADLVFVEGAADDERLGAVHAALPDARLVVNVSEADPRLRPLPLEVLASVGVALALYPVAPLLAAAAAARRAYAAIRDEGGATSVDRMGWDELTDLLGLPALLDLEQRYAGGAP